MTIVCLLSQIGLIFSFYRTQTVQQVTANELLGFCNGVMRLRQLVWAQGFRSHSKQKSTTLCTFQGARRSGRYGFEGFTHYEPYKKGPLLVEPKEATVGSLIRGSRDKHVAPTPKKVSDASCCPFRRSIIS